MQPQPSIPSVPHVVSTLSGKKEEGFQDGPVETALFTSPDGIAIAPDGTLFIADTGNARIRMITKEGLVSTLAGNGTIGFRDGDALNAQFHDPTGLAITPDGAVLVADTSNARIRRIKDGQVTTLVGSGEVGYQDGPASQARLDSPMGIVLAVDGSLYISDTGNDRIRVLKEGLVDTVAGDGRHELKDGLGTQASLAFPMSLALGTDGTLYVAEFSNQVIRAISPGGQVRIFAGSGVKGFADGPASQARFNSPHGVAIGPDGSLYVTEANQLIRRVSPTGEVTTIAGDIKTFLYQADAGASGIANGLGFDAKFYAPSGIATHNNLLYVCDSANNSIRVIELK